MQDKHATVIQALSDSHEQLSSKLNETQNGVLSQLQEMREEISTLQRQQQAQASGPSEANTDSEQIIGSVKQHMDNMLEQMTAMQQQTQEQMQAANQELKQ